MCCLIKFNQTIDLWHLFRSRLIVHSRLFVENSEDALCARNGILYIRPQNRDLLNRLVEALDITKESYNQAKSNGCSKQSLASKQIPSANASNDRQRDIR